MRTSCTQPHPAAHSPATHSPATQGPAADRPAAHSLASHGTAAPGPAARRAVAARLLALCVLTAALLSCLVAIRPLTGAARAAPASGLAVPNVVLINQPARTVCVGPTFTVGVWYQRLSG